MDIYGSSDRCPIKEPPCILGAHVDTTMAHGSSKVIVPVCPMNTVALVKVHGVRHVREIVARACHVAVAVFGVNVVMAGNGGVAPDAG